MAVRRRRELTLYRQTIEMTTKVRGSGFKYTVRAVFEFSVIWVGLLVATVLILTISMMMRGIVPPELHGDVWYFLATRVPIITLAAGALAVFTTTRLAGPWVGLHRALDDVKNGDMDRRLTFRRGDKHLRDVERSFNEMMEALNERAGSRGGQEADDRSYSPTRV